MKREIILGTRPESNGIRDAVHVPVISVIAHANLRRSEYIGIVEKDGQIVSSFDNTPIGIVDPFSPTVIINKDDDFWLCLYPNTITSLRHVWEHPVLSSLSISEKSLDFIDRVVESKKWISNFAAKMDMDYDELIFAAKSYIRGSYVYDNSEKYKDFDFTDFWNHYHVIFGGTAENLGAPFTCSC